MIKKTYKFVVAGTRYIGSDVEGEIEIEFTEEEYNNEKKREEMVEKYFVEWLWQNIDTYWEELED